MSDNSDGTGGLTFDKSKRQWPNELNVFGALILIIVIFEVLGQVLPYMNGQSLLFDTRDRFDSIFNEQRLRIIIVQVAIIGIIALGVTQVIITAGIDLSSGSVVGATAMIAMSFAQVAEVNGNPNPKAIFGEWALDLPWMIPVFVGLAVGLIAGLINGILVAYSRIPPFIATLGMMLFARGVAQWWSRGNPVSFPTEGYAKIGAGMMPVIIFLSLAVLFHFIMNYTVYGKHTYAIGSNEQAARMHVAIMGDNGAGKSTFVRQITGVEQRTRGEVIFDGQPVNFAGPLDAREAGIETVFQTLALADDLNVPDNLFLGREKTKLDWLGPFRLLDYKAMKEDTMAGLVKTGVKIPNIKNTIANMSGGQRQCVAIARTATFASKLTIMDEPTAALGVQETAQVENIIRTLKDQGESLILVSHNMRQVFDLVDRIIVFRRGRICANLRKEDTDGNDVVAYITGAKTGAEYEGAA